MVDPRVSVVVCTYDRPEFLRGAMQSLVEQSLAPEMFETIVVDNASKASTAEVVQGFQRRYPAHSILLVLEPRVGLCPARNAGLANARGAFVAYMDDDARADRVWLEHLLRCFDAVTPTPACVGGPILPFYTSPKPGWFLDEYEVRSLGDRPLFVDKKMLSGSNVTFRRTLLEKLGGFSTAHGWGMAGQQMYMGDEAEVLARLRLLPEESDRVIYYSPDVAMYHWVPPRKMTVGYFVAKGLADGYYYHLTSRLRGGLRARLRPYRWLLLLLPELLRITFGRRGKFAHVENWAVACGARVGYVIGSLGFRPATLKR